MCTVIPFEEVNKPLIAEEDMIVYKIGYKFDRFLKGKDIWCMKSRYESYVYVPEELHETELTYSNSECCSDSEEGMYAETLDYPAYVKKGFHSLAIMDYERASMALRDEMFFGEFTIPKGSKYHHNGSDNIVSNKIIFNKFIECK